jgi:predicted nuclease of predicted toxin-antitoxin system
VRFLIDAQLPPALARMLSARGHLAEHVTDIGPADASDRELWRYAFENQAVLVTKDEDFSSMLVLGGDAPAVVWIRVGNTRRQALIDWFEPMVDRVVETIEAGNDFIELR